MRYITETNLQYFKAWSGGLETLKDLKELCKVKNNWEPIDQIDEYLDEFTFETTPTETQINDFLWFERDFIAELLGYKDYDEILKEINQ